MLTPVEFCKALQIAAIAALVLSLMEGERPLSRYWEFLGDFYHKRPEWIAWLAKPLGYCGFCFSFWFGVFGGLAAGSTPFNAVIYGAISTLVFLFTQNSKHG